MVTILLTVTPYHCWIFRAVGHYFSYGYRNSVLNDDAAAVKLWESAIRVVCWCVSAGLLAESGPGQGYIQLLIVLDQRRVSIVEDQLSQRWVEVEGLSKAITCWCPVDHTVLHISIHPVVKKDYFFHAQSASIKYDDMISVVVFNYIFEHINLMLLTQQSRQKSLFEFGYLWLRRSHPSFPSAAPLPPSVSYCQHTSSPPPHECCLPGCTDWGI